jgi:RNA polymerase sigma factor (sigma-70 family)
MRLSETEVADVSQAVWMRLYEHIDDIRDASAVKSWLVTTARREAFALMRKQPNTAALTFDVASLHDQGPAERLVNMEEREAMQRAWERLRAEDGMVLDALVLNGRVDYEKASAALGRPIGSLGPTRQRALRRLRQLYDHELSMVGRRRRMRHR